jgi:hypothetical protein
MAGFFDTLILLGFTVTAAESQVASASPSSSSAAPVVSTTPSTSSGRFELLRKAFDQLSPEQQERILQNLRRWQDLSSDEREVLRQRERVQKQKQEASINEAYLKSGLQLNEEQRSVFRKRYLQERRRLEEQLVREIQEKRQIGIASIIDSLKKEFTTGKASGPAAAH